MTDQIIAAPYFDGQALRRELTAIFRKSGESAEEARPIIVERLKQLIRDARAAAQAGLNADGDGRKCAQGLSHFEDELIRLIYAYVTVHIYRTDNPDDAEHMAVIATGGYGRALLAPGSDIDLLFLLPYKQTAWGESVVEYILMILWDLGQKVGHATRTIEQSIRLSLSDMTIRTAILDSRLILGRASLFDQLMHAFKTEVVPGTARAFIEAKLAERDDRHKRSGQSRYLVEPNIKDGKGGIRDLHTLHWIATYIALGGGGHEFGDGSIYTAAEQATFRRCEDFLWTVRCHLHFLAGRPEERLSFDRQPALAERLNYRDRGGLRSVERFMKHYFLVAKDVGDLTTILCSALEVQQVKRSPGLDALLDPLGWRTRRRIRRTTDFRIDNGRLNVADPKVFDRDPVNLIRFFAYAEETGTLFHPAALRLIRQSLRLIDDKLRNDPEANRIFLELLTAPGNCQATLRRMNEAGVLGRFVPDFGTVVSMMQFNMYHSYTVDEHLIRTVGIMSEIDRGESEQAHPLSHRLIRGVEERRRVLYVAAFLHDVAKGREEDHSIAGARVARQVCPRLGLSAEETELVAWLIEHHLDMSTIAQSRDLSDPKTARDFADVVQTPERLKLLLLLTVADIRAVGPTTWNGWKGQLLRNLYAVTEPLVEGRVAERGGSERISAAQEALRKAAATAPPETVEAFVRRHYGDYWLKTDTRKQVEHMRLIARTETAGKNFATDFATDAFTAVTELTVLAPNHPRLLSLFAGACAAAGANIVGAHVATTRDGFALDTFLLQREFDHEEDERRRAQRIGETIEKLLKGSVRLSTLMAKKREIKGPMRAFRVAPEVVIDNSISNQFTVIEVAGLDRPGLLYELTSALSDLNLDITSAHITTFGERAVDTFYVTDLTNKKIDAPVRQKAIRDRLSSVLQTQSSDAVASKA